MFHGVPAGRTIAVTERAGSRDAPAPADPPRWMSGAAGACDAPRLGDAEEAAVAFEDGGVTYIFRTAGEFWTILGNGADEFASTSTIMGFASMAF